MESRTAHEVVPGRPRAAMSVDADAAERRRCTTDTRRVDELHARLLRKLLISLLRLSSVLLNLQRQRS